MARAADGFGTVDFEGVAEFAKLLAKTEKDLVKEMRHASQDAGELVAAEARKLYAEGARGHGYRHRRMSEGRPRAKRPTSTRSPVARYGGTRFYAGTKWSKPDLGRTIKAQQSRSGIRLKAGTPSKWHAWFIHGGHAARGWNRARPSGSPAGDDVKGTPYMRDAITSEWGPMMRAYRRGIEKVMDEYDRRQDRAGSRLRARRDMLG